MSAPRPLRSAGVVPAGVLAGSLSESEASRRVYLAAGGLALLGLLLLVGTVWWWRSTRNEHPSLAPLEVMGARRWRKAGDQERQRLVDGVRPEGAQTGPPPVEPEPVDLAALAVGDHAGFDDLREIDELLGLDVEHLLALKPHPDAPSDEDGVPAEPAEGGAAEGEAAAIDDETIAIGAEDVEPAAVDTGADDDVEAVAHDAGAGDGEADDGDTDGDGDAHDDGDEADDGDGEPGGAGDSAAPRDPLLERTATD